MQQTADKMVQEVPAVQAWVELGDAVELTLGEASGNSEDKRYQYN
jgi:hypothetical protein